MNLIYVYIAKWLPQLSLVNIRHHIELQTFLLAMRTFNIYSLINFQIYSIVNYSHYAVFYIPGLRKNKLMDAKNILVIARSRELVVSKGSQKAQISSYKIHKSTTSVFKPQIKLCLKRLVEILNPKTGKICKNILFLLLSQQSNTEFKELLIFINSWKTLSKNRIKSLTAKWQYHPTFIHQLFPL